MVPYNADFSETVAETLKRISPRSEDVRYIVELPGDGRTEGYRWIKVHKLPKSIPNLKLWMEQKVDEETTWLQQKLES